VRPRSTELRVPRGLDEWSRYHDIRKRCIFNKYHRKRSAYYFKYDPGCRDECDPNNHPLIFLADVVAIGTIRIDVQPSSQPPQVWSAPSRAATALTQPSQNQGSFSGFTASVSGNSPRASASRPTWVQCVPANSGKIQGASCMIRDHIGQLGRVCSIDSPPRLSRGRAPRRGLTEAGARVGHNVKQGGTAGPRTTEHACFRRRSENEPGLHRQASDRSDTGLDGSGDGRGRNVRRNRPERRLACLISSPAAISTRVE
jgi:hypothetical protein